MQPRRTFLGEFSFQKGNVFRAFAITHSFGDFRFDHRPLAGRVGYLRGFMLCDVACFRFWSELELIGFHGETILHKGSYLCKRRFQKSFPSRGARNENKRDAANGSKAVRRVSKA